MVALARGRVYHGWAWPGNGHGGRSNRDAGGVLSERWNGYQKAATAKGE